MDPDAGTASPGEDGGSAETPPDAGVTRGDGGSSTGLRGVFAEGETVTLTGAGFGTNELASAPLLFESFADGEVGAPLAEDPMAGSWVLENDPVNAVARYSAAVPRRPGDAHSEAHHDPAHQWGNFILRWSTDRPKLHQEFWARRRTIGLAGQHKLLQIHGNFPTVGDFAPGFMLGSSAEWWVSYPSTESGTWNRENQRTLPMSGPVDEWFLVRLSGEQSDPGAHNGSIRVTFDRTEVASYTDLLTRENADRYWGETSFFHGLTNQTMDNDIYLDDCWAAQTWARVVITDTATPPDMGAGEDWSEYAIQLVQRWTDTEIDIRVNQGMLAGFSGRHVHVFDDNNVPVFHAAIP